MHVPLCLELELLICSNPMLPRHMSPLTPTTTTHLDPPTSGYDAASPASNADVDNDTPMHHLRLLDLLWPMLINTMLHHPILYLSLVHVFINVFRISKYTKMVLLDIACSPLQGNHTPWLRP
jgi:hypothetical protein